MPTTGRSPTMPTCGRSPTVADVRAEPDHAEVLAERLQFELDDLLICSFSKSLNSSPSALSPLDVTAPSSGSFRRSRTSDSATLLEPQTSTRTFLRFAS